MDMEAVRSLTRKMADKESIDPYTMAKAYEKMCCRSLEVSFGCLSEIAARAAADGARDAASARACGGVRVFAPETGSPWHKAVALEGERDRFVVLIEYSGKPDPVMDKIMADLYRSRGAAYDAEAARAERAARPPEIENVEVMRYWENFPGWDGPLPADLDGALRAAARRARYGTDYRRDLAATLADAAADKYVNGKQFSVRPARAPYDFGDGDKETKWRDSTNLHDIDGWRAFFPMLKEAIGGFDLGERFKADAAAYAAREFDVLPGFPSYEAAERLGDLLAKADCYLPRDEAVEALLGIEAEYALRSMEPLVGQLEDILAACRAMGHVDAEHEFDHNDLDNFVHAPETGDPALDLLAFRDQNRCFVVGMRRDDEGALSEIEVRLHGEPAQDWFDRHFKEGVDAKTMEWAAFSGAERYANPWADRPLPEFQAAVEAMRGRANDTLPLARFPVYHDGGAPKLDVLVGPEIDAESIKSWNTVTCCIETASCCLGEAMAEKRAPR
jgi:hypothetical protein